MDKMYVFFFRFHPPGRRHPDWDVQRAIRKDNRESQPGVELLLELQFINVNTCKPVVGAYVDMWHAVRTLSPPRPRPATSTDRPTIQNATGVYSGFEYEGTEVRPPHPASPSSAKTRQDSDWLRGLQPTDENGVSKHTTIWPGHYSGRAVHTHIRVRTEGTISGGK